MLRDRWLCCDNDLKIGGKKKIGEKKEEDRCQLMMSALTDDFASSHLLSFCHKIAQNYNFVDILW